jgi:hypothetical protein
MAERYRLACQRGREQLPGLYPRVAAFLDEQRRSGGLYHEFSELKLLELAEILDEVRPRTIVELGGGCTTAVLAEYAFRDPSVFVLSVDESEIWQAHTRARLAPEVRERIWFVVARRIVEDREGTEVCRYSLEDLEILIGRGCEFLYVDGPVNDSPSRSGELMPCVDAVNLLASGHRPKAIAFDYRLSSVRYLAGTPYAAQYAAVLHHDCFRESELWNVQAPRHHSVFRRRCEEPKCSSSVRTLLAEPKT